ncbi:uncharacterized protein LOC126802279 [Argentina anserina]|uniref:uncharacterized protein LOC126802279 n=1 Tax=Argentina anserina TaxID=57926 RepID=UPI0021769334|nr:uncharacterized protein LOC126802279 [Potentilla anserina]
MSGRSTPISSSAGSVNAGSANAESANAGSNTGGSGGGDAENEQRISKPPTGGNWRWQCNFCKLYFNGSHTRVKSHLLKEGTASIASCTKVNPEAYAKLHKLVNECKERLANAASRQVPLPSSGQQKGSTSAPATSSPGDTYHAYRPYTQEFSQFTASDMGKKRKTSVGALAKAWNNSAREECDGEVARMFYTGGLSFNLARNPHYRMSYVRASTLPGYVPPGYNALRTTLLAKERRNIEKHLEPIKLTWRDKGVSICSDGWSDAQKRPLINVMATCERGPMMLRAKNCEGEYKDHKLIAKFLKKAIKEIGYENVVQVVTDNAPVCSKAGALVESKYPTIFWTPCVVHTLNLALKNICTPSNISQNMDVYDACCWIQPVAEDVMFIKNFIMNHGMRLVMFNDHCNLKLLSVAPTRFVSTVIMFKRFKMIKNGLQQMVISPKWDHYKEDDYRKAASVKEKLLDELMWDDIDYILTFTEPIYEMIRKADTDKPCLHLVYEWWDNIIEKVKKAIYRKERKQLDQESTFWNAVYGVLINRWTKSNTSLHCLAHSLNPKYYSAEWLNEDPNRVAPQKDLEVTNERKTCFMRYFVNEDDRKKFNIEFANFSMAMAHFGSTNAIRDRYLMEPLMWWAVHGSSAPTLQGIAFKLVGQPCSSSCCERNWSTYNFIHSLKRNKIRPQRAEDLVFVHTNLRLLARQSQNYNQGSTKMWDVRGDEFDSLEDTNVGRLEIAELSLDEPQLEAVLFGDDDDIEVGVIEEDGIGGDE